MHRAVLRSRIFGYLSSSRNAENIISYPSLVLTFGSNFSEIASLASLEDCSGVTPGCLTLEARVVFRDPSIRWVRVHRSSRSSASVDQNHGRSLPFLSLTLADRTGCSFLELWRNAALYVYEQAQNWHLFNSR